VRIVKERIKNKKTTLKLIKYTTNAKTKEKLAILLAIANGQRFKGFYNHGAEIIF